MASSEDSVVSRGSDTVGGVAQFPTPAAGLTQQPVLQLLQPGENHASASARPPPGQEA